MVDMKRYTATALGALMLAAAPMAADALTVEFDDSSTGVIDLTLTGVGSVSSGVSTVGSYSLNSFSASSFDFATESELNSVALDISGGDAGSMLTVRVSDTGYAGGADAPSLSQLFFNVNGTALGNSVSIGSYVDNSDTLFGQEKQIGSTITATNPSPGPGANDSNVTWGGTETDSFALTPTFSMTQIIEIDPSVGRTSFDAKTIAAVPVPAAGIMLLTALGGLGGAAGLRRRRKA